jgi:hypothetical protein
MGAGNFIELLKKDIHHFYKKKKPLASTQAVFKLRVNQNQFTEILVNQMNFSP